MWKLVFHRWRGCDLRLDHLQLRDLRGRLVGVRATPAYGAMRIAIACGLVVLADFVEGSSRCGKNRRRRPHRGNGLGRLGRTLLGLDPGDRLGPMLGAYRFGLRGVEQLAVLRFLGR